MSVDAIFWLTWEIIYNDWKWTLVGNLFVEINDDLWSGCLSEVGAWQDQDKVRLRCCSIANEFQNLFCTVATYASL